MHGASTSIHELGSMPPLHTVALPIAASAREDVISQIFIDILLRILIDRIEVAGHGPREIVPYYIRT